MSDTVIKFATECVELFPMDSDLTETTLEAAIEQMTHMYGCKLESEVFKPCVLIASQSCAFAAGRLCEKFGLEHIILPDALIGADGWAVVSKWGGMGWRGVGSKGA